MAFNPYLKIKKFRYKKLQYPNLKRKTTALVPVIEKNDDWKSNDGNSANDETAFHDDNYDSDIYDREAH